MSSAAVPKRCRRRKSKPTLPLGLSQIFARFKLDDETDKDERCCDVAGSTSAALKGEPHATPVTPPSDQWNDEFPSNRDQSEANTSGIKKETDFVGEKDVVVHKTQALEALTELDTVHIAMQLRATLQEKGPSQEKDLLQALSPLQAQLILAAYGTLTAFLDRQPGFQVQHEHPHSLIYYHNRGGNDESIQVGASPGPTSSPSSDNGRRCSDDHAPLFAHTHSLSDDGNECTVSEGDDGQEKYRIKDSSIQVTSPPGFETRALQKAQQMADSGAQTQKSGPDRFEELQSMLRNRDAEIAALKEKFATLLESHASEVQRLHVKIAKLPKRSSTVAPPSAAQLKKNRPTKEFTCTDKADTQISSRPSQPRRPQLQRSLPFRRTQPEVKLRLPPVVAMDQADKKSKKSAKQLPGPEFCQVPDHKKQNTAPCPNVESTQSSLLGSPTKRNMERKISRIVQMVRKKHPEHTEEDTRMSIDNLRRLKGGFSRMTFSAIVALVHSDLEASRKENH
ncbi:hypothetical protein MTO96_046611 [Rhipicephalus appendiculatus]